MLRIRLWRMGKKHQPSYRIVVMDSRSPRDGGYIEQLGLYNPRTEPATVEIDTEKGFLRVQLTNKELKKRKKKCNLITLIWGRMYLPL